MFRSSHDIRLPREYDARLTSRLVSSHIFLRFRCSFSGMDAQFALGQNAPSICINLGAEGPKVDIIVHPTSTTALTGVIILPT